MTTTAAKQWSASTSVTAKSATKFAKPERKKIAVPEKSVKLLVNAAHRRGSALRAKIPIAKHPHIVNPRGCVPSMFAYAMPRQMLTAPTLPIVKTMENVSLEPGLA